MQQYMMEYSNQVLDDGEIGNCAANDGQILRCKFCREEFSDSQALGCHWIVNHKKEAQCFFQRICMSYVQKSIY